MLYDESGASSREPNSSYRSHVAARSPGGALVMPLGSSGNGRVLGRGRFWVVFSASPASSANPGCL